jgi:PEP-CTERM motif
MIRKITKKLAASAAIGATALAAIPASALTIELRNTGGVEVGTQAFAGFSAAARFYELLFTNDVNVKLNVGFGPLGAGILGSTGSTTNVAYVGQVLPQLAATGNSALDAIASANLPNTRPSGFIGGQAIDAIISGARPDGTGVALPLTRVLDADASGNNSAFSANTSVLKAIGITPTYTGANALIQADGSVTFSSNFAFDFDPTNGITAGEFDFIGIAIHEIGHALGFRSGVDVYDVNTGFTGNLNNFAIQSIWDLFRYSQESAALGVNDWAIGGNPYFSIDGGQTIYNGNAFLSTGSRNGNGRQASHWLDSPPSPTVLGLLDPTAARGQQLVFDTLDLAAFDATGWNVRYDVLKYKGKSFSTAVIPGLTSAAIPEPASWALMIAGFAMAGSAVRRRRVTAKVAFA